MNAHELRASLRANLKRPHIRGVPEAFLVGAPVILTVDVGGGHPIHGHLNMYAGARSVVLSVDREDGLVAVTMEPRMGGSYSSPKILGDLPADWFGLDLVEPLGRACADFYLNPGSGNPGYMDPKGLSRTLVLAGDSVYVGPEAWTMERIRSVVVSDTGHEWPAGLCEVLRRQVLAQAGKRWR